MTTDSYNKEILQLHLGNRSFLGALSSDLEHHCLYYHLKHKAYWQDN